MDVRNNDCKDGIQGRQVPLSDGQQCSTESKSQLPQGPGNLCAAPAADAWSGFDDGCEGWPHCRGPGRKLRLRSDYAQADGQLPLHGPCEGQRWTHGFEHRTPSPGLVTPPRDDTCLRGADQEQAVRNAGLHPQFLDLTGSVPFEDLGRPAGSSRELTAVDRGIGAQHKVESEGAADLPLLYTGRFHALLQEDLLNLPKGALCETEEIPGEPPQACDAAGEPRHLIMQFSDAKMPKPELLALSGGGGQEASQERQRGAGVWSSSSSAEHSLAREAQAYVQVPVSTWNLAGAGKKKVKAIVATVLEQDVVAVQEYPKQAVGWHTIDHGRLNAVLYQDVVMYRAVGVMYDKHKFRVCKRRKSTRGIWILLQHLHEGRMLWVGSVHLPVNEAMEEVHRFTDEFMDALPATDHPAILLGDMNTHFTWVVQQGVASPKQMHSRWSRLRQVTAERGFSQVAPAMEHADKPTCPVEPEPVAHRLMAATRLDAM